MVRGISAFDLKGKRILIRVDFNVPLDGDRVADDFRIRAVIPTIQYCLKAGATIVLMSHLGRPGGKVVPELSLIPAGEALAELLEMPIKFSHDCVSEDSCDVSLGLKPGEVHLLENLRFHSGESNNDPVFSARLAKHGQIYINDAFGTAHRAHASNVGVTSSFSHKGIGFLIEKELRFLGDVLKHPKRPLTLILGGAKVSSKLQLIEKFVHEADTILIGGGMAFTFLKAQGKRVGGSLVDSSLVKKAHELIRTAKLNRVALQLPTDLICASGPDSGENGTVYNVSEIPEALMGLDIGPETVKNFTASIQQGGTLIWNGPVGVFESPGFESGSRQLAESIAQAKEAGAIAVVGGGDTAAAVRKFGLHEGMSHVSTGGGASLELLSGNTLPAIHALEK